MRKFRKSVIIEQILKAIDNKSIDNKIGITAQDLKAIGISEETADVFMYKHSREDRAYSVRFKRMDGGKFYLLPESEWLHPV